jgi:CRISPR-associated endonuclease/helicase Cas3
MTQHRRVLTIVHLRKDAKGLAELLPPEGRHHLSALMCAAHRLKVLDDVREALEAKRVCRVVATQLVEAGVDIDFPVVYRTLAGLDSLTQAAGRCNREGRLVDDSGQPMPGRFIVFRAETKPPLGVLRMALETTETLIQFHGNQLDLLAPETSIEFFRSLYFKTDPDSAGIQAKRADLGFADVEQAFQMIEDYSVAVVMPYGDALERLERYRRAPSRGTRRALQPFIVQITPSQLQALSERGAIEQIDEAVLALSEPFSSLYDDGFGLRVDTDVDTSQAWIV